MADRLCSGDGTRSTARKLSLRAVDVCRGGVGRDQIRDQGSSQVSRRVSGRRRRIGTSGAGWDRTGAARRWWPGRKPRDPTWSASRSPPVLFRNASRGRRHSPCVGGLTSGIAPQADALTVIVGNSRSSRPPPTGEPQRFAVRHTREAARKRIPLPTGVGARETLAHRGARGVTNTFHRRLRQPQSPGRRGQCARPLGRSDSQLGARFSLRKHASPRELRGHGRLG